MRKKTGWQVMLLLFVPGWAAAEAPIEELPPPTEKSVLAQTPAASDLPQPGWGLYGVSGRHYVVGRLAMADYVRSGQRHIVSLTEEDPAGHAQPDPNFLYYREESTRHRWAIGRQATADRRYSIYFQAAESPGAWVLFQRALGSWDDSPVQEDPMPLIIEEPTCGGSRLNPRGSREGIDQ